MENDENNPQRLMPEPQSNRARWIAGGIIALIIVIAAAAGGYYWAQKQNGTLNPTIPLNANTKPVSIDQTAPPAENTPQPVTPSLPTVPTIADYKISGDVKAQTPAKIGAVKIFDAPDATAADKKFSTAYKVGTFIGGKYKGADFLVIMPGCDCPGDTSNMARVAKLGNVYTVLGKYSDPAYTNPDQPIWPNAKFAIDKDYRLTDLEFPLMFSGPQPNQKLLLQLTYPSYDPFILDANVIPAFMDPKLGQVYTNVAEPNTKLDDAYMVRNGFYIKGVDGSIFTYAISVNFVGVDNVPAIAWTSGGKNTQEYTYKTVGGCGASNLTATVPATKLSMADLLASGKTSQGDIVYLLKDPNNPLLKDLYDNNYYVPDGQQKLAYSDFVKARPYFFWIDPFGRTVEFQSNQFIPQAECGKPVIYLYPQTKEQVNVQLAPQGGFTYTEPTYNNGWNVIADPSGNLTEVGTNRQYPYLFWEGRGGIYETPKTGFAVAKSEIAGFFDKKLALLGLNEKETADFKEFWTPKMQGAPYYFVTFMGNRTMDQIAPMAVTPRPDTIIRVLMDFQPLQHPIAVQGYNIHTPERRGFVVVEWGGVLR